MKIRIIGCSGSGKTYLAKRLSKKYNIKLSQIVEHFSRISARNDKKGYDRYIIIKCRGGPCVRPKMQIVEKEKGW